MSAISSTKSISSFAEIGSIHSELVQMMTEVKSTHEKVRSLDEFERELRRILRNLVNAQTQHEKINDEMIGKCIDEEKFRTKAIFEAQSSANAAGNAISKCQVSLKAAKANKPNLVRALRTYKKFLEDKTHDREVQHELYLQRRRDWHEAIKFLNDFIKQVNNKLRKSALVELSENLLRHTSKFGIASEALPVLAEMLQNNHQINQKKKLSEDSMSTLETLRTD